MEEPSIFLTDISSTSTGNPASEDSKTPAQPPDGGLDAWLQVFGAFCFYFGSLYKGLISAYGSYQNYYENNILSSKSSTEISWIGTVQSVLVMLVGVASGPIFDRGYITSLLVVGSFLIIFGFMVLSLATQYYQILLAQGFCVGLGSGLIYTPGLALVATSFAKRRGLALALVTGGAPIGGLIYPLAFQRLLPEFGFQWTTRILGFLTLILFLIGCFIIIPRLKRFEPPEVTRSFLDIKAFAEPPFTLYCIFMFLMFLGYWPPFFVIPTFAQVKLGATGPFATHLLMITNGTALFGRLFSVIIAERFGMVETLFIYTFGCAVMLFAWLGIDSAAGFDVWVVIFGFLSGGPPFLAPAVVPFLCPTLDIVGTRMGMLMSISALGVLLGNPVSNLLNDLATVTFWRSQLLTAVAMAASCVFLVFPMLYLRKRGSTS